MHSNCNLNAYMYIVFSFLELFQKNSLDKKVSTVKLYVVTLTYMLLIKQLFSKYCQNNLLFKVFSHIMILKNVCIVNFFTGINWFSNLSVVFKTFFFSCSF